MFGVLGLGGTTMSGKGTETRRGTKQVLVRFTPDQFDQLRGEADLRGVSVQQLLRERSLGTSRAAS